MIIRTGVFTIHHRQHVLLATLLAACLVLPLAGCGQPSVAPATTSATEGEGFDAQAYQQRLEHCVEQIRARTDFVPDLVIVLGSGLGDFASNVDVVAEIPYDEIEGFPVATAPTHDGKLVLGTLSGRNVAVMQGRIHYYEGYAMPEVVLPLRVLHLLGANTVILTNSVGSINADYAVGDFMAVEDHISSFVPSPLIGENLDELGPRFVDMTQVYDPELVNLACQLGEERGIAVHRGVFVQVTGPQFETPTEIELYRSLGADTVGMSTAVEAIAARHMGMRVCAINCITNMAAGMQAEVTSDEATQNADKAAADFETLILALVDNLPS